MIYVNVIEGNDTKKNIQNINYLSVKWKQKLHANIKFFVFMKSGWNNCDQTCHSLHFAIILIKNEGRHSTGIDVNVPQNHRTTEPVL